MNLQLESHPTLELDAFVATFAAPLRDVASPPSLIALLAEDAVAPLSREEAVRTSVRDMLRHSGYKPTGRGKPASEYLVRAASEGALRSINAVVDACNAVSLHSGLPVSVVDLNLAVPPLRVGLAAADARYVFNPSGQEIRAGGLLCLHDREGPCANAVKDAQRTKTSDDTCRVLILIWGVRDHPGLAARAGGWYRELLVGLDASIGDVTLR